MSENIANSDRQFLASLHQLGSATVPQLCDREEVTATAIRQRLLRLQAAGLVWRETVKATRGRPHHEYQLTDEGKKQLGDNYSELAILLWEQIHSIDDEELKKTLMSHLRDALVKRYGGEEIQGSLEERLQILQQTLSVHGFHVEVQQEGELLVLKENNCPYHELASNDRAICDLEHEVFEKILGVPLELTQRCVDGHTCCLFEASGSEKLTT